MKKESESVRKGMNATSGTKFAALPLVNSVFRSARAVVTVVTLSLLNLPDITNDVRTVTFSSYCFFFFLFSYRKRMGKQMPDITLQSLFLPWIFRIKSRISVLLLLLESMFIFLAKLEHT